MAELVVAFLIALVLVALKEAGGILGLFGLAMETLMLSLYPLIAVFVIAIFAGLFFPIYQPGMRCGEACWDDAAMNMRALKWAGGAAILFAVPYFFFHVDEIN